MQHARVVLLVVVLTASVSAPSYGAGSHEPGSPVMAPTRTFQEAVARARSAADLVRAQLDLLDASRDPAGARRAEGGAASTELVAIFDANADGRDDVLTVTHTSTCDALTCSTGDVAVVLRAHSGDVVWRVAVPASTYVAAADVSGDGRQEVVMMTTEWRDAGPGRAVFEQRISILDAGDGHTIWSRTFVGEATHAVYTWRYTRLVTGVSAIADASGDAKPDVLVTTNDWDWSRTFVGAAGRPEPFSVTTGHLLRGTDGRAFGSLRARSRSRIYCDPVCLVGGSWPVVAAIDDVSGDGRSDFLVADAEGPAASLRAVTATRRTLWRATASWVYAAVPMNLNGDAVDDLVIIHDSGVSALDGATGRGLWSGYRDWPEPVGDVDGDGGLDLRAVDYDERGVASLSVVRGATGNLIWARSFEPSSTEHYRAVSIRFLGDATGDQVADVFTNEFELDRRTGRRTDNVGSLLSGRDGSVVWSRPRFHSDGAPADTNGNGTLDLLTLQGGEESSTVSTFEGSDGEQIWTVAVDLGEFAHGWHRAQLDDDAEDEILARVETRRDGACASFCSEIVALDETGILWRA